jgi:hypothetical protein
MAKSIAQLRQEIAQFRALQDQAGDALATVKELLQEADERRVVEGEGCWDGIIDNLERTLHVTKSRLTTYEQDIKQKERELSHILETSPTGDALSTEEGEAPVPREIHATDILLPGERMQEAERILAIPLDVLGTLTLEEVAAMNAQLFEEPAEVPQPATTGHPSTSKETPQKSHLAARIEQARQKRETLAATHKIECSLIERLTEKMLRDAMAKLVGGAIKSMTLEKIEVVQKRRRLLQERTEGSESDRRLRAILNAATAGLQERAAELRRKRAQMYTKKKP